LFTCNRKPDWGETSTPKAGTARSRAYLATTDARSGARASSPSPTNREDRTTVVVAGTMIAKFQVAVSVHDLSPEGHYLLRALVTIAPGPISKDRRKQRIEEVPK
jgi:hypothetical protein